jgi:transposase-like protein
MLLAFTHEDQCRKYLQRRRWPGRVRCPRCNNEDVYRVHQPFHWQCHGCSKAGYRFSVLTNTPFQGTKIPLLTWFTVLGVLIDQDGSNGRMSILKRHHALKIGSYRTTWRLYQKCKKALGDPTFRRLMEIWPHYSRVRQDGKWRTKAAYIWGGIHFRGDGSEFIEKKVW